jgi:hypothetical protein
VISSVSVGLASIRAYVVSNHLATIPSDGQPIVAENTAFYACDNFRLNGHARTV